MLGRREKSGARGPTVGARTSPASAKGSGVSGEEMQPAPAKCANRPTPEGDMGHPSLIAPPFPARALCVWQTEAELHQQLFFLWAGAGSV
jgi:hypothetical protein